MNDFFEIYDVLISSLGAAAATTRVLSAESGEHFSYCESETGFGIAMAGDQAMIEPMYPTGLAGLSVMDAAKSVKSWNLREASTGLAAINAQLNTLSRIKELDCAEPFENHAVRGLKFDGATVGIIGHMRLTEEVRQNAATIYTLERRPRPGDYPDSACEALLPKCDYVFISGSTMMNKTLPRLIELSKRAYTVLLGPSVPMCPALLEHGIDRLSGMVVADAAAMREYVRSAPERSPYSMGTPFLLTK